MKKRFSLRSFTEMLLQKCFRVEIARSAARSAERRWLNVSGLSLSSGGTICINKADFFPSSFRIEFKTKVVYIDPVEMEGSDAADYILITHNHPDHFSLEEVMRLSREDTIVIGPGSIAEYFPPEKMHVLKPGSKIMFPDFNLEAVHAYNLKPVFLWIKPHQSGDACLGYVMEANGIRIYHSGDTDSIPELSTIGKIDVALLAVGGDKLTMGPESAASIVHAMRPTYTVPMHYSTGKGIAERFRELAGDVTCVEMME